MEKKSFRKVKILTICGGVNLMSTLRGGKYKCRREMKIRKYRQIVKTKHNQYEN